MAGSLGHYEYVSDDGNTYRVRLDQSNSTLVGATASTDTTTPGLPVGYDMRYVYVEHPTSGARRKLVCPDPTNGIWTGATGTVTMNWLEGDAATVAAVVRGRVGERRRSL